MRTTITLAFLLLFSPALAQTTPADVPMIACIKKVAMDHNADFRSCRVEYHNYCIAHALTPADCYQSVTAIVTEVVKILYGSGGR